MATTIPAATSSSPRAAELRTWLDDLVRVETRLYNALNEALRRSCRMTMSQYEFLDFLARRPGARAVDLAGYFAVGLGATSKGVDRLIAAGWVGREPNPADGRSSLLSLTESATHLVAEARAVVDRVLEELVGSAAVPTEVARTGAVLADLRARLETGRVGTPSG